MTGPVQQVPSRKSSDGTGPHVIQSTIHTERYTSWNGTLEGRQAIVVRTIKQGFRHILSNKWIKILLILMYFFTVFIPLLLGFFGIFCPPLFNTKRQSQGLRVKMSSLVRYPAL